MEKKVSISDAAREVAVEPHVLRYWEVELGLNISRNAQGHRFYSAKDIRLLGQVKYLKEQGFQLKAIKLLLTDIEQTYSMDKASLEKLKDQLNERIWQEEEQASQAPHTAQIMQLHPGKHENTPGLTPVPYPQNNYMQAEEKLRHFEAMMRKMIRRTMEEMAAESEERICDKVTTRLLKEIDYLERQKSELHEKQVKLLQDILAEVKGKELEEVAATEEPATFSRKPGKKEKNKEKKRKLFAKSSGE